MKPDIDNYLFSHKGCQGSQIKLLYGFDPSRDADGTLQLGAFRGTYVSRGSQIKLVYGFDPSRDAEGTLQLGV